MKISFNIHTEGLKDRPRIIDWHRKAKPSWSLVMNDAKLITELRAASPQTSVIYRSYPPGGDEGIWKIWTPAMWVADARAKSDSLGCWMYCLNEPGFGDDMLGWLCETIELSVKAGLKLVVGNFAVGTPEPADWKKPAAVRLLALLDKYRSSVILGLHEYACGVITSGFVGGPPTELKDKDGRVLHRDFIRPASWPGLDEARTTTMWHVGRVKFLIGACESLGIKPPRIVITEAGFDSLKSDPNPDLRRWIDGLPHDMGEVRGWRTLRPAWANFYPQWWHEQAYFEQLKYADQIIYAGLPVEGQMVYNYGHADPQWETFDCEGYDFLLQLLEGYAATTTPPPAPPPVVTPPVPVPEPTPAPTPEPEKQIYSIPCVFQVLSDSEEKARETVNLLSLAIASIQITAVSDLRMVFTEELVG